MINPVSHIANMASYALADLSPPMGKKLISLAQNESLRPPAPSVVEALKDAAVLPQVYPDPDWTELRHALASLHDLDAAQVLCGNGSLDLIGCLARAYLSPQASALAPRHAYPFFRTSTLMTGARFDVAEEKHLCADVGALLAAVQPDTKILFLANPGNPTGTRLSGNDLRQLRDQLSEDILLVIDEAYGEFADHLGERLFDLVENENTIVLRTLSKAYGLAGQRVGWGAFPVPVLAEVRKVMNPNNVALSGQKAANAALLDQVYMHETCSQTMRIRDRFIEQMRALGLVVPDSYTNFALLCFASRARAMQVDQALQAEGVFLRAQAGAGLNDCLRATVGSLENMDLVAELIKDALTKEVPR